MPETPGAAPTPARRPLKAGARYRLPEALGCAEGTLCEVSHASEAAARDIQEKTADQHRAELIRHVWKMVDFYERQAHQPDVRGKLDGLARSILATLDGAAEGMPSYAVHPLLPVDNAGTTRQGPDIAGGLHGVFHLLELTRAALEGRAALEEPA